MPGLAVERRLSCPARGCAAVALWRGGDGVDSGLPFLAAFAGDAPFDTLAARLRAARVGALWSGEESVLFLPEARAGGRRPWPPAARERRPWLPAAADAARASASSPNTAKTRIVPGGPVLTALRKAGRGGAGQGVGGGGLHACY